MSNERRPGVAWPLPKCVAFLLDACNRCHFNYCLLCRRLLSYARKKRQRRNCRRQWTRSVNLMVTTCYTACILRDQIVENTWLQPWLTRDCSTALTTPNFLSVFSTRAREDRVRPGGQCEMARGRGGGGNLVLASPPPPVQSLHSWHVTFRWRFRIFTLK